MRKSTAKSAPRGRRAWWAVVVAASAAWAAGGCYDFHKTGPAAADPVPFPETVAVRVEYVQTGGCKASAGCGDLVVLFGSWMRTGGAVQLTPDASHRVWSGTVPDVPVNYPPEGSPYKIRIYDPFLQAGATTRYTGERVTFGGQRLSQVEILSSSDEAALAYVDSNGFGHNPF
jgi:hypothetical protein